MSAVEFETMVQDMLGKLNIDHQVKTLRRWRGRKVYLVCFDEEPPKDWQTMKRDDLPTNPRVYRIDNIRKSELVMLLSTEADRMENDGGP